MGLLYADGCVHDGAWNNSIAIALQEGDVAIIEAFRGAIGSTAPILITGPRGNHRRFAIYSQRLFNRLCELGCTPRKSLTCTFPDWLSEDMLPHFLRGYLDGDGWVIAKGSRIGVGMIGSIPFIESAVRIIKEKLGVSVYVRGHHKCPYVLQLQVNGGNQARTLLRYLYADATIYLERKKLKSAIILNRKYFKRLQP